MTSEEASHLNAKKAVCGAACVLQKLLEVLEGILGLLAHIACCSTAGTDTGGMSEQHASFKCCVSECCVSTSVPPISAWVEMKENPLSGYS